MRHAFGLALVLVLIARAADGQDAKKKDTPRAPADYVIVEHDRVGAYFVARPLKEKYDALLKRLAALKDDIAEARIDSARARAETEAIGNDLATLRAEIDRTKLYFAAASVDSATVTESFPLAADDLLLVDAQDIEIRGWDRPEVKCLVEKTVLGAGDKQVADDLAGITLVRRRVAGKELFGYYESIEKREGGKAEWERFPLKEFLGREFTHLVLKGLAHDEGNGYVDFELKNETGQGTIGSRPRRMARLTLFVPKCRRVGVRGALGGFKVRSLEAPLSVMGQGNRDYGSSYEINDLGGSFEADNVPIHRIDGARGDVSVIVTAYPGDSGTSMNGPSLTTQAYPPKASEYRKVRGALRVRACRVDLTLEGMEGRVDVANDFGRTVWVVDRPPAKVDHRVVSESGTIEVRIGKEMPGDLPMMLFSECGRARGTWSRPATRSRQLKFSSTRGNDVSRIADVHQRVRRHRGEVVARVLFQAARREGERDRLLRTDAARRRRPPRPPEVPRDRPPQPRGGRHPRPDRGRRGQVTRSPDRSGVTIHPLFYPNIPVPSFLRRLLIATITPEPRRHAIRRVDAGRRPVPSRRPSAPDSHPGRRTMRMTRKLFSLIGLGVALLAASGGDARAGGLFRCGHRMPMAPCGTCGGYAAESPGCAPCAAETTAYETVFETIMETVAEQVPTTQMQTRYRTEYKTEQFPVTRTVYEQVPTTQTQTRYRTEYRTESVPVTRTVYDQVPTTVTQTRYRTEYKAETYTVNRPVPETIQVPRTYTVTNAVPKTVQQTRTYTVSVPRTKTNYVTESYVETQAVPTKRQVVEYVDVPAPVTASGQATASPQSTPSKQAVTREVTETQYVPVTKTRQVPVQTVEYVPEQRSETVPVTTIDYVPEQRTEMVPMTQVKMVPETQTRQVPVSIPEQVPVTVMTTKPRQVAETITRQVPISVPEQVPVTVMTTQARQVTETQTRQVPYTVPEQVPVTVMTTQYRQVPRQVAHQVPVSKSAPVSYAPAASPQVVPSAQQ